MERRPFDDHIAISLGVASATVIGKTGLGEPYLVQGVQPSHISDAILIGILPDAEFSASGISGGQVDRMQGLSSHETVAA